jgi:hypothetical protein
MTVYVATVPYRKLIEQVRETGAVAVSFQQLGTNLTVQVKGKGARVTPVDDDAFSRVTHYVERFASGVAAAGYDARLIKVGMAYLQDEISAVTFAPEAAFSQTPGPLAGGPLAGGPLAGGPLAP